MIERTIESFLFWLQTSGLRIVLILAGALVLSRILRRRSRALSGVPAAVAEVITVQLAERLEED